MFLWYVVRICVKTYVAPPCFRTKWCQWIIFHVPMRAYLQTFMDFPHCLSWDWCSYHCVSRPYVLQEPEFYQMTNSALRSMMPFLCVSLILQFMTIGYLLFYGNNFKGTHFLECILKYLLFWVYYLQEQILYETIILGGLYYLQESILYETMILRGFFFQIQPKTF